MKIPFLKRESETAIDPVCDMKVQMSSPPGGTARHDSMTYFFCAAGCRQACEKDPLKYINK